jgi:hypothetical protein
MDLATKLVNCRQPFRLVAWQAGDRVAAADALREGLQGFGSLGHRWGLTAGALDRAWRTSRSKPVEAALTETLGQL